MLKKHYEKTFIILKMFLLSGFLFGATIFFLKLTILFVNTEDLLYNIVRGAIDSTLLGCVFGFFLTFVTCPIHFYFFRKSLSKELSPKSHSPCQDIEIIFEIEFQEAMKTLENISSNKNKKYKYLKNENNKFYFEFLKTWKSYGEVVTAEISLLRGDKILLRLSSRPKYFMTLIDYGKGYENIILFLNLFKTCSGIPFLSPDMKEECHK